MEQTNKLLEKILELLAKNEARISTNEFSSEGDKLIEKTEKEGEEASKKIQSTFDRIHDKLFTVNGILVASFFGLGKFPTDNPIVSLWLVLFPIFVLCYLIYLEQQQMEIYRHASQRMNWNFDKDVAKYGKMINRQNLKSLFAIIVTFGLFIYLAIKVIIY
ncbi:hypothetical protein BZARG_3102 [Bizionia argentinensis JUB59]|uniref:Uncharacterized protein n=1 Tax=Bizionia argentinensis JUB59 TaxID=1046627 RepID=G2EE15_9FLAO|nr:hypothetical protein [Bizionia argentinensis]EGV43318.1 hypothetical protein BZARG_3102 [Bizionia argentinensis JUB59]